MSVTAIESDVVIVNGWAMPEGVWYSWVEQLGIQGKIFYFNMDQALSPDEWAARLTQEAPSSAIWIGWSLGGMLALDYASRFPERVEKLVLLASSPRFLEGASWPNGQPARMLENMVRIVEMGAGQLIRRFALLQTRRGTAESKEISEQLSKALSDEDQNGAIYRHEILHAGLQLLKELDLREEYRLLSIPAIALLGEDDQVVKVSVQGLVRLNPSIRVTEIPGMGHFPFLSFGADVAKQVRHFCLAGPDKGQS